MIATLLLALLSAHAGELAGVVLPETATVGGSAVHLNGMGLREKYYFDVYVGALYLANRTESDSAAIQADEPKRIVMHFLYAEVPKPKLVGSFEEGFSSAEPGLATSIEQLNGWMETVHAGDEIVLDYAPGTGTTITVKGQQKGTIEGAAFMRALWSVYLGPKPPTAKLKRGMLGR